MKKKDFWTNYWLTNKIVNNENIHAKVGRTIKGVPIEENLWERTLIDLEQTIDLNTDDLVLDIAAGSGAISLPFSKKVRSITANDISEKLLENLKGHVNIQTLVCDARDLDFQENSFSKIIIYFAIQHFDEMESLELMKKSFRWLKPNGILYIGDIPDVSKKFVFFNNKEREQAYFNSILENEPIIGHWFDKDFFLKAGDFLGYRKTTLINQPQVYINSHYRFDVKLEK